jgi:ornithine cyclodeaminase/alanine dehydrogenase-like protein (mu-crystallin family)
LDLFASIADMAFAVPDRADPTNCVSKTDADVLMRVTDLTVRFAEAGEIFAGSKMPERAATTVFKSVGIAVEDIAAARLVYDAVESG